MSNPDPRHDRLLRVGSKVVGVLPASQSAPLVQSAIRVASAMGTLSAKASEIANATQLLDSERASRLEALKGPAVEAARSHLATVATEKARIERARADAFPVPREVSFHRALQDQAYWTRLMAMDASQRALAVARATADVAQHVGLAGAVLRADAGLIDLPPEIRARLMDAAMREWRPDELASLEAQDAQLELATRAAEIAEATVREHLPQAVAALKAPLPEPQAAEPASRGALSRQEMIDRLAPEVLADLLGHGRYPSMAELRAAAGLQ